MAYTRRDIRGGAVQTTISTDITSGATTIPITASTGWPDGATNGPFYVVIDPGLSSEEKVLCATRTTLSLAVTTRGADGSTASAHSSGAKIYPVITAVDADEANYAVSKTVGKVTAAGDILVGDGANSMVKLAKGSSSTALTVDSGGTLGYTTVTNAMLAGSIAYSKLALTGAILNADLAGSIAYSKLTLTGSVLNADVSNSAAIAYSKLNLASSVTSADIVNGTIVNADISASAAISTSKLALTAGTGIAISTDTISVDSSVTNLGAWTSFTPTLTQGGAVAKTVVYAAYARIGRTIVFSIDLAVTGSGTGGSDVSVTLPVTAVTGAGTGTTPLGSAMIFDTSATTNYKSDAYLSSTTVMKFVASGGSMGSSEFTAGLANGDAVRVNGTYEAAS